MAVKKPSLLKRYEDPTGEFSNQSLQAATWYAKHRETLRLTVIIFLIVWCVLTVGFSFFTWGKYFFIDYPRDQANIKNISYSYVSKNAMSRLAPTPLEFTSPQLFNAGPQKYDFYLEVSNPNKAWNANVTYRFSHAGGVTEELHALVLPGERRPLVFFGYSSEGQPGNIQFDLVSITWERIDPHLITDPVTYIGERVSVSVDALVYTPANRSQGIQTPVVKFSVINNSLFSYWEFPVVVKLVSNTEVVGVVPLVIPQFKAGETRDISLGIFFDTGTIDSIILEPLVNVFDRDVYLSSL